MDSTIIELLILAAVALFVLSRLYSVLGRKTGAPPKRVASPGRTPEDAPADGGNVIQIPPRDQDLEGLEKVKAADTDFNQRDFLGGARVAYEMIVNGFAAGDRESLRPLLNDEVFANYDQAITEREASGGPALELLRLRRAELVDGDVVNGWARVQVSFESELGDGDRTHNTKELWTFERELETSDPNWRLCDVSAAS